MKLIMQPAVPILGKPSWPQLRKTVKSSNQHKSGASGFRIKEHIFFFRPCLPLFSPSSV